MKSKYPVELVLTVEEAIGLAEIDPEALTRISTFLEHLGYKKKEKSES